MTGFRVLLLSSLSLACAAAQSLGQFNIELVNQEGATAPCMGIGPVGGPLAKKCAEMAEQAGFIRVTEVGFAGLTIGNTGKDDGVILAVQKESAAAHAGLEVGDAITAVEDKPVKPTPGKIAAKAIFGRRGEALHLTVRRNGALQEVSLVRSPQSAPPGPKSPNMFIMVRPMINWRGQFVPCMGAGPLAPAAFEMCNSRFKPHGYIKTGEFDSTQPAIRPAPGDGCSPRVLFSLPRACGFPSLPDSQPISPSQRNTRQNRYTPISTTTIGIVVGNG